MKWIKKLTGSKEKSEEASDGNTKSLRVSHFLNKKQILFFHAGPSKRQVFGSLIAALDLTDPNAALKAILAREEAGSTVVAPGLALPHARVTGIRRLRAALGIAPEGIPESRRNSEPIKLFVLFLGPADQMTEHLGFLAAVSSLFQRPGFVAKVLMQKTSQDVLDLIEREEQSQS